jgi:hypothetical protein
VGGDHAEQREAAGDVEPDEAGLRRPGHGPMVPVRS